jgi:eukaryotic-like serine/threonine-protein kinase
MIRQKGDRLQTGKYIIEKKLGEGGSAYTYQAFHPDLDRFVVIKIPRQANQYSEQFAQEALNLAKLKHRNVVRVIDVFSEDGIQHIVMEYVSGQTLLELVESHGTLLEGEAVDYIKQVAEALTKIHRKGLVHRDINPRNIMIDDHDQCPVLIDFGIAKEFSSNQSDKSYSKDFAPWEQCISGFQSQAPTVDVYSLAATLYYAVTGKKPECSYDRKLHATELRSPREFAPRLSESVYQAIMQGMAIEATARPQTMADWLRLLDPNHQQITRYSGWPLRAQIPFTTSIIQFAVYAFIGWVFSIMTVSRWIWFWVAVLVAVASWVLAFRTSWAGAGAGKLRAFVAQLNLGWKSGLELVKDWRNTIGELSYLKVVFLLMVAVVLLVVGFLFSLAWAAITIQSRAEKDLAKVFSHTPTFTILLGTSWIGLGVGWCVYNFLR